ncbi:MAG: M28 family peptidase [Gammaproteobacteria bacterium]
MRWWIRLVTVVLAILSGNAAAAPDSTPQRLERHVRAIAPEEHNTARPRALERSARYIETTLESLGYQVRTQPFEAGGQKVRNIEVSLNASAAAPRRLYIVGAHYDSAPGAPGANDNGSGSAALLELARLLKPLKLPAGTELRFVFYVNEEPPYFMGPDMGSMRHARALHEQGQKVEAVWILETIGHYTKERNSQRYPPGLENRFPNAGNFIAIVSTLEARELVDRTLVAFKGASDFPAEGLAAPASVGGVTLSDHASYLRYGYPALMFTDTAFMRYPHYHTPQDTPDKVDYASLARVVDGLVKALGKLVQ